MSFRLFYSLPDDQDIQAEILTLENTQGSLLPHIGDQVCVRFPDGSDNWRKVEARGHILLEGVPHVMLRCRKLKVGEASF